MKVYFSKRVSLDEKEFRDSVWKTFAKALDIKQDLIFDFKNVDYMASTVVPKLCCLGEIAKNNGIKIQIIVEYKLCTYLAGLNFWHIAYANHLFIFERRYLDITFDKKVTNALFCIEKDKLKEKYKDVFEFASWAREKDKYKYWVRAELTGINNSVSNAYYTNEGIPDICKAVMKTVSAFIGYSECTSQDTILEPIVELVHNAVWHSEGRCYFLVQTSTYKGTHKEDDGRVGIDISVSDTGRGLYESLINKDPDEFRTQYFRKDDFLKMRDKNQQDYCSIIEALYFRRQSGTRGLYDIIMDLVREPEDYFREIHLINRNVAFNMEEGLKRKNNSQISQTNDMSNLINKGIKYIDENKENYFCRMQDIGFSFCVDISITIP